MTKKSTKIKAKDIIDVGPAVDVKDIPEGADVAESVEIEGTDEEIAEVVAKIRASNPDAVEAAEADKTEDPNSYENILAMINKATGGK